jgi:hypothetical protein
MLSYSRLEWNLQNTASISLLPDESMGMLGYLRTEYSEEPSRCPSIELALEGIYRNGGLALNRIYSGASKMLPH